MTTAPKLTEAIVLDLLRARHTRAGNGGSGEYAFLTHVRDSAGFDARRTFDAVTVGLWPSRGLLIDVFEVKVSRSDWLRELADPAKAEAAHGLGDRFTVVAPHGCVHDDELPPTWGHIHVLGKGDDAKPWRPKQVTAPALAGTAKATAPKPVSRAFLVGLLRSCPGAIPGGRRPDASDEQLAAAEARGREAGASAARAEAPARARDEARLAQTGRALEVALIEHGMTPFDAELGHLTLSAETIVKALKDDQAGGVVDAARISLTSALKRLGGPLEWPGQEGAPT